MNIFASRKMSAPSGNWSNFIFEVFAFGHILRSGFWQFHPSECLFDHIFIFPAFTFLTLIRENDDRILRDDDPGCCPDARLSQHIFVDDEVPMLDLHRPCVIHHVFLRSSGLGRQGSEPRGSESGKRNPGRLRPTSLRDQHRKSVLPPRQLPMKSWAGCNENHASRITPFLPSAYCLLLTAYCPLPFHAFTTAVVGWRGEMILRVSMTSGTSWYKSGFLNSLCGVATTSASYWLNSCDEHGTDSKLMS